MTANEISKKNKMFITAAPVGAVPKFVDPQIPRFIPTEYVSVFTPKSEQETLTKRLQKEGWTKVTDQGLRLRIHNKGFVSHDDLRKLDKATFDNAMYWLENLGWSATEEGWLQPEGALAQSGGKAVLPMELLSKIQDEELKADFALELSHQGWQQDRKADFFWPHEQGETYINPELVLRLERNAPEFLEKIKNNHWEICGEGFWLHGKGGSPYVPVYPRDIVEDAYQATVEGAAMVHLHTRDLTTNPYYVPGMGFGIMNPAQHNTIDAERYDQILPDFLDKSPNTIINLSTSARGGAAAFDDHKRRSHLKFYGAGRAPDVASFSPGAVIFQQGGGYENPNVFLKSQISHMESLGIRPEIEVFNHTIVENSTGAYAKDIRGMGTPPIFMLVTGVDQYKDWPKTGLQSLANKDDSLIPTSKHKKIVELIKSNKEKDRRKAIDMTVSYLKPVVEKIREAHPDSKISTLMAGNMQFIATDVAIALNLDGIRIGLEDGLSIQDKKMPGGVRRALGTADQVRRLRIELETRGIHVQSAEELRDDLGIQRPEIQIFRDIERLLAPVSAKIPDFSEIPPADTIIKILDEPLQRYKKIEDLFVDDVLDQLKTFQGEPSDLAELVKNTSARHGIAVRYFIEEGDRYNSPRRFKNPHMYTVQPLNFMRELLQERNIDAKVFDKALKKFAVSKGLIPSVFIPANQFKSLDIRFLDYASFISSRYNMDRTDVVNTSVRQDPEYSATMSVLFNALEEKMRGLRHGSSAVKKSLGAQWYKATLPDSDVSPERLKPRIKKTDKAELERHIVSGGWVALPSTPTTNYPTGQTLMEGLTSILQEFLVRAHEKYSVERKYKPLTLMSASHSGIDKDGQEYIEASMLKNRFALNTDRKGNLSSYSVQQIYDQLLLPRIVKSPSEIVYEDDGTAKRNDGGVPVSRDKNMLERISEEKLEALNLLKLIGHSSGIATMQQLDNLLRADMERLGFSQEEQKTMFAKSILVHFGTAANVHLSQAGTTVVDVTASNDIRSIAGRTDPDIVNVSVDKKKEFQAQKRYSQKLGRRQKIDNSSAEVKVSIGEGQKASIRYSPVFLSEDPARLHDGHTIKRYVGEAPEHLKALVVHLDSKGSIDDPQALIDEAKKMVEAQELSL